MVLTLTSAMAEGKVKSPPMPDAPAVGIDAPEVAPEAPAPGNEMPADAPELTSGEPVSVQAFKTCLNYARGDATAAVTAEQVGWETFEDPGESPFVKSYSGNKTFADVGDAALFSLVESYPDTTFGYCRVDMQGPIGEADVNALRDLPELAGGQVITNGDGTFGSWKGAAAEPQMLLLSHQTADVFALQMTIVTHRAGPAVAK